MIFLNNSLTVLDSVKKSFSYFKIKNFSSRVVSDSHSTGEENSRKYVTKGIGRFDLTFLKIYSCFFLFKTIVFSIVLFPPQKIARFIGIIRGKLLYGFFFIGLL